METLLQIKSIPSQETGHTASVLHTALSSSGVNKLTNPASLPAEGLCSVACGDISGCSVGVFYCQGHRGNVYKSKAFKPLYWPKHLVLKKMKQDFKETT